MKTYFLIDYENVSSYGLEGCEKLNESYHIIIFYTGNPSIEIDCLYNCRRKKVEVDFRKVTKGSQSVDMSISQFIGSLIVKERDAKIVIISKDKDYDGIIEDNKKRGIKISRQEKIALDKVQPQKQAAGNKQQAQPKKITDKTTLNNRIMQVLCKEGYDNRIAGDVASIVSRNFNKDERKMLIHEELVQEFGQSDADKIYRLIKELL